MGRSRAETVFRGAASERAEQTDIRSGDPSGVAVRQTTSPGSLFGEAPPPRPPTRTGVFIAIAVAVVVAIVAVVGVLVVRNQGGGSTASDKIDPVVTLPANPPASVDPAAETKAAIIDAYKKGEELFVAIGRDPQGDPFDPRLKQYLAGDALFAVGSSLQINRTKGQVFQGQMETHPTVVSINGDAATLHDCNFDHTAGVELATGKQVSPPDAHPSLVTVEMQRSSDGQWRDVTFKDMKAPCDPAS